MRESGRKYLSRNEETKVRLGRWTKQDEDDERRRGLRLRLIRK